MIGCFRRSWILRASVCVLVDMDALRVKRLAR
jgi:hypothetical protein